MESTILKSLDERFELSRRIDDKELPTVVYAVAGALDAIREEVERTPKLVDGLRDRVIDLRDRVTALPERLPEAADDFVADVRRDAVQRYNDLAKRGEQRIAHRMTEKAISDKVGKVTKKVTPAAARASVSARTTAKKVSQSPTAKKTSAATKRATAATKRAVAAVTEVPPEVTGVESATKS